MWFRKRVLVGIVLFATIITASCASQVASTLPVRKAPAAQQIYRLPEIGSDIATFDPALVTDGISQDAIQNVFTGLVELDEHAQIQPVLAQSWEQSPDGLTWTFHLRAGLTFSDGTPLTSTDVAYSMDRALQPATRSPVAQSYLGLLKGSEHLGAGTISTLIGRSLLTPDAQTIQMIVSQPAPYFLSALTYPCSWVVEKTLVTRYGASWTEHLNEGGGAGPWKVRQWRRGVQIRMEPNRHYVGPHPQLNELDLLFYRTADTAYKAYQTGQVDVTSVPAGVYEQVKGQSGFHQASSLNLSFYGMNELVKPFDNVHIRQAFALALNKALLAARIFKGQVIPTNHIVPQGMNGYNPKLTGPDGTANLTGNPPLARALLQQGLKEEGWHTVKDLPPIPLAYSILGQTTEDFIAVSVQEWQDVLGVTVHPQAEDFNTLLNDTTAAVNNPKGIPFWYAGWSADYPDPQDWTTLQFDRGQANNSWNYGQNTSADAAAQQRVQRQLEEADQTSNQVKRMQLYQQAEQQLVNDVAWLPLFQNTTQWLVQPYVVGLQTSWLVPPDQWSRVFIAVHSHNP